MDKMTYINKYLSEAADIIKIINKEDIGRMVDILLGVRNASGRIFMLGVGGSASNASHAVNDFRKITGIESYAPTDNVAELTAWVNDEGWDSVFIHWLKESHLNANDCIFVLSVGGGNAEKKISNNLVEALKYAEKIGSKIIGIVGRDGGYTAKASDGVVIIPVVNTETITPHTEAFQAIIWHLIASHPLLKHAQTKWESVK